MEKRTLMALSPLDGRYQQKVKNLRSIFSEYGLIKFRVLVEVRWLETLAAMKNVNEVPALNAKAKAFLDQLVDHFSENDAAQIKEIESTINHDVKAVEYFLKEKFAEHSNLKEISEFIHFGCTSEDINNLAYAKMMAEGRETCIIPKLEQLLSVIQRFAHTYAMQPMLARTHGQSATPTTVGKEFANFYARLKRQMDALAKCEILGKLNGATGNYNALACAYPAINWQAVSEKFIADLGLTWNAYTTQIEPHDYLAEFFSIILRINTILIDFNRDMWSYIAINYFKQKANPNEVGSSTMPHKINPIDFENSEGNLGLANALLDHMIHKLPISRWQRDLSDSTVLRNIGVAIGHTLLAFDSTIKGVEKLEPDKHVINADLNHHWEVLGEAIQTVMRRYGLPQPYEQLKAFTRGKKMDKTLIHDFITTLKLPDKVKKELLALTPADYTGYAGEIAKNC